MKRSLPLTLVSFAALAPLVALACASTPAAKLAPLTTATVAAPTATQAPTITASVDESVLDQSTKPCDDFYQYACGGWLKATPIPDDESRWGRSFSTILRHDQEVLRGILEDMAAGKRADQPYAKALGDFYGACMDEQGIEQRGLADLQPILAGIDEVRNAESLAKELAHLHAFGVNAFFALSPDQDNKDSSQMIAEIAQAGLGMPDRDYYLDDKKADIRAKYTTYLETLSGLLGDAPAAAKAHAATVIDLETKLARASMTRTERRDPDKTYNRLERKGLVAKAPSFRWATYLAEAGLPAVDAITVNQPEFVKAVSDVTTSSPLADIRTYLRLAVARRAAPSLGQAFVDADFAFRQALGGAKTNDPRWKRCVRTIDRLMGEALGQAFVKAAFPESAKADVKGMVDNLQAAMGNEIHIVPWMDDPTRTEAEGKLATFTKKIGYPDTWRDYSGLAIDRTSFLNDGIAAAQFETRRELAKIGKPVDRTEWLMTPPTVNAYYQSSNNEIVFPAGILQPPFYGPGLTRAMRYGAIGAVMGHEITHGFDDQGRKFDAKGNRRDWWSPSVAAEFEKRATCVSDQFDGYVPVDDIHIKGRLTLGENIADLGGVKVAYAALKKAEADSPSTETYAYTEDQQFFLGYAQIWCENTRPEERRSRLTTDPHSPGKFRVDGPLSNLPEFAAAFSCKDGDAMVRSATDRCTVW